MCAHVPSSCTHPRLTKNKNSAAVRTLEEEKEELKKASLNAEAKLSAAEETACMHTDPPPVCILVQKNTGPFQPCAI